MTPTSRWITTAATRLKNGEVGILPFDTLLGITAIITPETIDRIFRIKDRPQTRPFLVIINTLTQLDKICAPLTPEHYDTIRRHWPGPVSIILPKSPLLPPHLTGDRPGIGVRLPSAAWIIDLITEVGHPLLSTSANRHGQPTPMTAATIDTDLRNRVDFVIDAPEPMTGRASTIINAMDDNKILR